MQVIIIIIYANHNEKLLIHVHVIEHRMMNANEVLSFNLDNIGNQFGKTKLVMGYCKDLDPRYL